MFAVLCMLLSFFASLGALVIEIARAADPIQPWLVDLELALCGLAVAGLLGMLYEE